MSPIAALRSRRSAGDLPPAASDEDLLAWSDALVHGEAAVARTRRRRTEPLRAERSTELSTDDLLAEIAHRAATVAKPKLVLHR